MPHRNIVSWNAILAAHRLAGEHLKAFRRFVCMLRLNFRPTSSTLSTIISASPPAAVAQLHVAVFRSGHKSNTIVGTALISGLIADGELAKARRCFDAAENRNAVTWTAIITGYLRYGHFSDALHLFAAAPKLNRFTFSAALAASARLCSLRSGESIHARILKSGEPLDTILATALIDMYGRCGDADAASAAADYSVAVRNAMIGAMGMNGRGTAATEEFRQMVAAGVAPDGTTFVHVLAACVHGGLVEEGEKVFRAMLKEFKVRISKEHIGCMVDLYGRAGRKAEAEAMAKEVEEEMGAGGYALIARVYGERGEWEKVREVKKRMEAAAGRKGKLRGLSWVESKV
ncbi:Pentatricopeptide repeat-containing protein [Dendrobium catenatum]|uniref:Pentatricopeptide repeat-containing protein n=1 Tax=Dendrobium catenatum TaxID=906689 RepID=A0A2I0XJQ8_9ASPA|nr:Pentatricopeptide repeat-containing protein [Dendrobium catenatum]